MLIIDTENSGAIRNKGHPFDPRNKLCLAGIHSGKTSRIFDIEYSGRPYGDSVREMQDAIDKAELVVGVNLKYDLHWLRRVGINIRRIKRIWDCQLAHFLITAQRKVYPSMDDMCARYAIPPKPKNIEKYWDDGIDTDAIPLDELKEYLIGDLERTERIQREQAKELREMGLMNLFNLCCQDLLVLQEMEWNGMKYDVKLSMEKAIVLEADVFKLIEQLNGLAGTDQINWESPQQLSALLYGGTVDHETRVPIGTYKSGAKQGQTRHKVVVEKRTFTRLVEPLEGSGLAKEGFFSTDAPTLQQLKAKGKAKQIIELVLKLSELQKQLGTYYKGIPKKIVEFQWDEDIIHQSLNQCVAVTGRLSSSKPNLQNIDAEVKECFLTRY